MMKDEKLTMSQEWEKARYQLLKGYMAMLTLECDRPSCILGWVRETRDDVAYFGCDALEKLPQSEERDAAIRELEEILKADFDKRCRLSREEWQAMEDELAQIEAEDNNFLGIEEVEILTPRPVHD